MDSYDYIQAAKGQALMAYTPEDRAECIRTAVDRAFNLKGMAKPGGIDYETIVTEVEKKVKDWMDGTMYDWKIIKCQTSKVIAVY